MAKSKANQALDFVRHTAARCESATNLHNAFFGNGGQFGKLFPTRDEREVFFKTAEYQEIVNIREQIDKQPRKASA